MTVLEVGQGALLLYSPVPISEELGREIEDHGTVAHILAPSRFHHLFAGKAKKRFPNARLWGAPGLAEKRRDLTFDEELPFEAHTALPWSERIESMILSSAPMFNECLLFHKATRSLVCCDFLFNITEEESFLTRLLYRGMGIYKRTPTQSRIFRFATKREAAEPEYRRVLAWNPQRVLMAHGEILTGVGESQLTPVLLPE